MVLDNNKIKLQNAVGSLVCFEFLGSNINESMKKYSSYFFSAPQFLCKFQVDGLEIIPIQGVFRLKPRFSSKTLLLYDTIKKIQLSLTRNMTWGNAMFFLDVSIYTSETKYHFQSLNVQEDLKNIIAIATEKQIPLVDLLDLNKIFYQGLKREDFDKHFI